MKNMRDHETVKLSSVYGTSTADGDRMFYVCIFIVSALLFSSMLSHTRDMLNLAIATYDHGILLPASYVFISGCLLSLLY